MNRRLHNAMTASVAAGAVLLLALAAAAPGTPGPARPYLAAQPDVASTGAPLARTSQGGPRRHRQRLVMPYFSFSRS